MKVEAARNYFESIRKMLKPSIGPNGRDTSISDRKALMADLRGDSQYQDAFQTLRTDAHIRRITREELPERSYTPFSRSSDPLDQVLIRNSDALLAESRQASQYGLDMLDRYIHPLGIRLSMEQEKKVDKLFEKINGSIDILLNIDEAISENTANRKRFTTATGLMFDFFKTAVKSMSHDVFMKIQTILDKVDYSGNVAYAIQAREYSVNNLVNIRVHGLNLSELFKMELTPENVVKGYDFLSTLAVNGFYYDTLPEEPSTSSHDPETEMEMKFPLVFKKDVETLEHYTASILQVRKKYITREAKVLGVPNEVVEHAGRMFDHLLSLRLRAAGLVFNPQSPWFPKLRDLLIRDLQSDNHSRDTSLIVLNPNYSGYLSDFFRKAKQFARDDITGNEAFYEFLVQSIYRYVEGLPDDVIMAKDDAPSFLSDSTRNGSQDKAKLDIQQITRLVNSIKTMHSSERYVISDSEMLNNIEWDGLLMPTNVVISIPKDEKIVSLAFVYMNEEGEQQDIRMLLDLKKTTVEWNFIEGFEDPDLRELSASLQTVSVSVLSYIDLIVKAHYQGKLEEARQRSKPERLCTLPKVRNILDNVEVESRSAEKVKTRPELIDESDSESEVTPATIEQYGNIVLIGNKRIQEGLDRLSSVDRENVLKSMNSYNEYKTGRIKRLHTPAPDGTILYSRRVGHNRILLKRNSSGMFEVVDIDVRKNIYRRYKIES